MNGCCPCGGNAGHSHDSSMDDDEGFNLRGFIDFDSVRCLNESAPGSCKHIFKKYSEREQPEPSLSSNDDDPELILYVSFTEAVKIKSISITGGPDGSSPSEVKVWVDRDDIDFTNAADVPSTQTLSLVDPDEHAAFVVGGSLDYPTRQSKFQSVTTLTFFISDNFGADASKIIYMGFKGVGTNARRGIVDAVYECRPVPTDHKAKQEGYGGLI